MQTTQKDGQSSETTASESPQIDAGATQTESAAQSTADNLDARVAAFNEELQPLLKKHSLVLASEAGINDGRIVSYPRVYDADAYRELLAKVK